jgi:hypothetical protein
MLPQCRKLRLHLTETQVQPMNIKKKMFHLVLLFLHPIIIITVLLVGPLAILLFR